MVVFIDKTSMIWLGILLVGWAFLVGWLLFVPTFLVFSIWMHLASLTRIFFVRGLGGVLFSYIEFRLLASYFFLQRKK